MYVASSAALSSTAGAMASVARSRGACGRRRRRGPLRFPRAPARFPGASSACDRSRAGYFQVMTVEAIKNAIVHLNDAEREEITDWFAEMQEDGWDCEMVKDFSPGGRGEHLVAEIDREIDAGNHTSLEDGLRQRRESRARRR